jgi:hypothetical protein
MTIGTLDQCWSINGFVWNKPHVSVCFQNKNTARIGWYFWERGGGYEKGIYKTSREVLVICLRVCGPVIRPHH